MKVEAIRVNTKHRGNWATLFCKPGVNPLIGRVFYPEKKFK